MKTRTFILFISLLSLFTSSTLLAQGRLALGFDLETIYCFTDLNPRMQGEYTTRAVQKDLLNLQGGFNAEYRFDFGLGFCLGADMARKRVGFLHESGGGTDAVNLWGHSEFYSIGLPLKVSFIVLEDTNPYFELAPYLGFGISRDIISYRNLTRRDENFNYLYSLHDDYPAGAWSMSATAGVKFRTMIDQLGLLAWTLGFSYDLSALPPFDYQVEINGDVQNYSQTIKMHFISLGMSYYFSSWEIFDGRFMKRRY